MYCQCTWAGPPLQANGVQQQQQLRAGSAPQVEAAGSSSNGIKQPVRADSLVALESSLAQKEEEVRELRRQLDEALMHRQDAEKRKAGATTLAGCWGWGVKTSPVCQEARCHKTMCTAAKCYRGHVWAQMSQGSAA